jgi:succinate-acetate transporter protein
MSQPVGPMSSQAPPASPVKKTLIANAIPVGVGGFALTTFALGLYTSGVLDPKGEVLVFVLAAFYGGLVQLIAGYFALARGDIWPAAFMTSYGAFWFTFVGLEVYVAPNIEKAGGNVNQAVTLFLILWTIITIIFFLAAFFANWVAVLTFATFIVAIILEDVGTWIGSTGTTQLGGYWEMALAALAWYIVAAEIFNEFAERTILPLFPTPFSAGARVLRPEAH